MTIRRRTLGSVVAAGLATAAVAVPADAGTAKHGSSVGKIHVKLVRDHGNKSPKGYKICAFRTRANGDEFPVGHCDITNKAGIAVLTHVKTGKWPIGIPYSVARYVPAPKKLRVKAGHTTSYRWPFMDVAVS